MQIFKPILAGAVGLVVSLPALGDDAKKQPSSPPDKVQQTLEVIAKTPENIKIIREQQKRENDMWKDYDASKPKN